MGKQRLILAPHEPGWADSELGREYQRERRIGAAVVLREEAERLRRIGEKLCAESMRWSIERGRCLLCVAQSLEAKARELEVDVREENTDE